MKSSKISKFERQVRRLELHTDPGGDEHVQDRILAAYRRSQQGPDARRFRSMGEILMHNRLAQMAAVVAIAAAAVLGVYCFSGTPVKAVGFSEITEAMSDVPWMYVSSVTEMPGVTGTIELWIGFEARVQGGRMPDGTVSFRRFGEGEMAEYDPGANTITLSAAVEDELSALSSPAQVLESIRNLLEGQGATITVRMDDYRGRRVQVQEVALANEGNGVARYAASLYVDPGSKFLLGTDVTAFDANDVVVSSARSTYDYPADGPGDIYALGVPRDALIVDNRPSREYSDVRWRYEQMRAEAMDQYMAAIAWHDNLVVDANMVFTVDAEYKSGRKVRLESHRVFDSGASWIDAWPGHREQLGDSLAALLAWTQRHYDDPGGRVTIRLNDGQTERLVQRRFGRGWTRTGLRRAISGTEDLTFLANRAWPTLPVSAMLIEDAYAERNGLICVESLGQGVVILGESVALPSRRLFYLDPARSYLCVREVTERRPDAPWQEDDTWLAGIDPNMVPDGSINEWEIIETTQADNGYWYPHIIVERQTGPRSDYATVPLRDERIAVVYLAISPDFPDGIFDIDELPGR